MLYERTTINEKPTTDRKPTTIMKIFRPPLAFPAQMHIFAPAVTDFSDH